MIRNSLVPGPRNKLTRRGFSCLFNGNVPRMPVSDKRGGLNGSMQHLREAHGLGVKQLRIVRERCFKRNTILARCDRLWPDIAVLYREALSDHRLKECGIDRLS